MQNNILKTGDSGSSTRCPTASTKWCPKLHNTYGGYIKSNLKIKGNWRTVQILVHYYNSSSSSSSFSSYSYSYSSTPTVLWRVFGPRFPDWLPAAIYYYAFILFSSLPLTLFPSLFSVIIPTSAFLVTNSLLSFCHSALGSIVDPALWPGIEVSLFDILRYSPFIIIPFSKAL